MHILYWFGSNVIKTEILRHNCNGMHMWCDLAGSVGTRICNIFSFLFDWKPHLNQSSGSKVMSNWRVLRTIENNRNRNVFFWLYLTINAADFWLILLDRNTYFDTPTHCITNSWIGKYLQRNNLSLMHRNIIIHEFPTKKWYINWYSAPQSKNTVSINIKHCRYIHLMSNFSSIHFQTKSL